MFGFRALAVSADGKLALKKIDNLNVQLINVEDNKIIHHFKLSYDPKLFKSPINRYLVAKLSQCGQFVLFGTSYYLNRPYQYDTCMSIKTGLEIDVVFKLDNFDDQGYGEIAYSHDGQYLVSSNTDGSLNLTNIRSGELSCKLLAEEDQSELSAPYNLDHCYFSPCNRYLVVYLYQQQKQTENNSGFFHDVLREKLLIIDVHNGKQIYTKDNDSLFPRTVEFSNQDDIMLICVGMSNNVKWELIKAKTGVTLSQREGFKPLFFTENFIVSNLESCLTVMDLSLNRVHSISFEEYKPTAMKVSPNRKFLAVELENSRDFTDKKIYLYRIEDWQLILRKYAQQCVFSEDSDSIFMLTRDLNHTTYLSQFQVSDGSVIADKIIHPPQLSFFIRSALPGNRVILDNGHETWCEQLNAQLQESLRISHTI